MPNSAIQTSFKSFLRGLREHLEPEEIEAWVQCLQLVDFGEDQIVLGGVNKFFCNYIKSNHQSLLKDQLLTHFKKQKLKDSFQLVIQAGGEPLKETNAVSVGLDESLLEGLNPKFRFDEFINGGNSDVAYAASLNVGENPLDNKYNPLFLCGDVGLGKTHLVQAIGIMAKANYSNLTVRYSTAEEFTNDVINGIRFQNIQNVRKKYRQVDILIIDDIHFLEGKERTQEEFFHLFNELILNKKQVVLTSDRYPKEIKKLEERLISRFNSGMVARIYPPDFETRCAIIRAKIDKKELPLTDDMVAYLAQAIKSNVRDIEGILIHIEANWSLLGQPISFETIKLALKERMNIEESPKKIDDILKLVAQKFNVKVSDIKSDKRTQEISRPRQVAMYISREATNLSFPAIAEHFGGKNHTTVIQACKKTKEWLSGDPELKQSINSILREINASL